MDTSLEDKAQTDNLKGLLWLLVSVIGASVMAVAVRELSASLDTRMMVLLRSIITLGALIPALAWPGLRRRALRMTRPGLHLVRGLLIGGATHAGFFALAHLPLATATVLFFTAPIFATLLTGPIQGERVGRRRWSAVAAGFIGALIILRPSPAGFEPATLAALGSSLAFAIALLLSRRVAEADGPAAAYLSSVVITFLITLPIMPGAWGWPNSFGVWVVAAVMIASGTIRGVADIQAYRHGEAAILGPVTYLRLVFVGGAGYLLYDEVPDGATWAGAAIIIGAALYIARREAILGQNRRRARSAAEIVPSSK
ncbi:MAG: DMT family transporter [Pseudomonadota bacterium]